MQNTTEISQQVSDAKRNVIDAKRNLLALRSRAFTDAQRFVAARSLREARQKYSELDTELEIHLSRA